MCKGKFGLVRGIHGDENNHPDDTGPQDCIVDGRQQDGSRRAAIRYDEKPEQHDLMPSRGSSFGQDHPRTPLDKILIY